MRVSIDQLPQHAPGSIATLAGRLASSDGRRGVLWDGSGAVAIAGDALPPALSLVHLTGIWSGSELRVSRWEIAQEPHAFGNLAESEFWALGRDGGRKAHALRRRAQLLKQVRAFFEARGFLEVETPILVPSPGLDLHLEAMAVRTRRGERFLNTSPEYQMKRLLAGGFERLFQLTKCFRDDEIGARHQPEFTMLEWYRAFAGVDEVMRDTEELVAELARWLTGSTPGERAVLHTAWGPLDVTPPWPRITVREAFARFAGEPLGERVEDEDAFYRVMVEVVEPALAGLGAVFLTEYPSAMASLARKKPGDPTVAERFEAYVAGIELCNGFGELTDAAEQRARLVADQEERARRGLPVYPLDERFLAALAQGIPPSGGNALGIDRLIMLALGAKEIEEVVAIPASRL
jgi:lysyl-tRNA synthetase class 2